MPDELGITVHHWPAYSKIFDCGFSPVPREELMFCSGVIESICRLSSVSIDSVRPRLFRAVRWLLAFGLCAK